MTKKKLKSGPPKQPYLNFGFAFYKCLGFDDVTSMFGLGVTLSTGKDEKPSSCGSSNPISPGMLKNYLDFWITCLFSVLSFIRLFALIVNVYVLINLYNNQNIETHINFFSSGFCNFQQKN